MQPLARFGSREKNGQRRAVIGGCQPPGVAVCQHTVSVGQQLRAMGADGAAHLAVFLVNRPGFGQQIGGDRIRRLRAAEIRGRLLHPLDRPKQVDGRGAAGGQEVGNFIQPGEPGGFVGAGRRLHADTHAVGGGDADRRSAAHP